MKYILNRTFVSFWTKDDLTKKSQNFLALSFAFTMMFFSFSLSASAEIIEGFVEISPSRAVAYQYIPPQKGQPTIVMLNGLIYSLQNWDGYIKAISEKGYGVVLVAYSTQPESLRKMKETTPYYSQIKTSVSGFGQSGLETSDLAKDVMTVVDHLKVNKFHLQTLSFGSIVGSYIANNYADRLHSITLISPAVMASHRYTPYGESRHSFYVWQNQINSNPFYVPDYYYDLELYQTMRGLLLSQFNSFDLKGINFESFFNGVYQMARSSKYFDLKDQSNKPWPQTNIVLASEEDPNLKRDQLRYWDEKFRTFPESRLVEVLDVPHAIPGTHPKSLAEVTQSLITQSLSAGEHQFLTEKNSWKKKMKTSDLARKSCKSYL